MNSETQTPQPVKFWFTPEIEKQIRTNDALLLKIAKANKGVRIDSVQRWFKTKDDCLTTMANLELIRVELGLLETQELIERV